MARERKAFTLIEVLVAVSLGAIVIGSSMYLYHQGNKMFYKTTEHSAFREESLLCLETIARDIEQLMVSTEMKPNGKYFLLQPYEPVGNPTSLDKIDPVTKKREPYTNAFEGIRFWRYHSTLPAGGKPQMVAKRVTYSVQDASPGNPGAGKNLLRNGKQVNRIPLAYIAFVEEPNKVTSDQIGASKQGVLSVFIVPAGGNAGLSQNMSRDVMEKLREDKALVSRTFHLAAMESFYTVILNEAFRMESANNPTKPVQGVYKAVYDDAKQNNPDAFQRAQKRYKDGGAVAMMTEAKLNQLFKVEANAEFDDATAGTDAVYANAPIEKGKAVGAGGAINLTGNGKGGGEEE